MVVGIVVSELVGCLGGGGVCNAPCGEPAREQLEDDDDENDDERSGPSILASPTSQSSIFTHVEKSYMNTNNENQDDDNSNASPDLKLTESVDAHMTCISEKPPQLPLREAFPSLCIRFIMLSICSAHSISPSIGSSFVR